jgi:hypothetical protein
MSDLDYDVVAQCLKYEPETGKLFWLKRPEEFFDTSQSAARWNGRAGKEAFTANANGYRHGKLLGKLYRAHRIAWLLTYKTWPVAEIDHIDGDRSNNRIANLRDVSKSQNQRNRKMDPLNKSGFNGVYWYARSGKWRAKVHANGKHEHLGTFGTLEEAIAARHAANIKYGFTERHGKPAGATFNAR